MGKQQGIERNNPGPSFFHVRRWMGVFVWAYLWILPAASQEIGIYTLTSNLVEPIRFATYDLEGILREFQIDVEVRNVTELPAASSSQRYRIIIATAKDTITFPDFVNETIQRIPNAAGSYAVTVVRSRTQIDVVVTGLDVTGTMYGIQDVAEQIAMTGTGRDLDRALRDRKISPTASIRGWRLMLQHQALEDPFSWFHTDEYWQGLFDRLARSRINVLELHGVLEIISTQSYSVFPYFYFDENRPSVGIGQAATAYNLKRLQWIVTHAAERGIHVFLVSYRAAWSIPDRPIEEDNGMDEIGNYTYMAVQTILQSCPNLLGIGFRLGESGRGENFYSKYFIPALSISPNKKPILVIRSWGADKSVIDQLASNYDGPTVVEVKTNGDHLALPYPITGGQMVEWSSYGYQDILNGQRKYDTVFELFTSADHQIFPWADPVFAGRMIKACITMGSNGFTLEAPSAYTTQRDVLTNLVHADLGYYEWAWQKDWLWPLLWGRLGYDPELDSLMLSNQIQRHFFQLNPEQAKDVLEALGYASAVIPAIAVSTCRGPSGRDTAPELEPGPNLNELIDSVQPIDSAFFMSLSEEIELLLANKGSGKVSCRAYLSWVQNSIDRAVQLLGKHVSARLLLEPDRFGAGRRTQLRARWQELEAMFVDFQALQQLCTSVRFRLEAAYHLGLYRRSDNYAALSTASSFLTQSQDAWKRFTAITTRRFHPFLETRRMQSLAYHWAWLNDRFAEDTQILNSEQQRWESLGSDNTWIPTFGHIPARKVAPGEPLVIEVSIPPNIPVQDLEVRFRNSAGEGANLAMGPSTIDRVWTTTVPENAIRSGRIEYFISGVLAGKRVQSTQINDNLSYIIPIGKDNTPPRIQVNTINFDQGTGQASIEATIDDETGISAVRLWHKPLTSDQPWQAIAVQSEGNMYKTKFSVPKDGVMISLEAVDDLLQGTMWPNVFVDTPYKVLVPR